ncbi:uncharacterized protein PV06_04955 [Exophiala oligosperma]|uniref:Swi5-dependent recombination DNA repair protein 1 n=2 Tax=Chaetothyriales TaxID=34395 RepID=A0A0D2E7W8_9EURO|nr:uncharacterized protein PV06_04955 [Exophiala oligosperma]KAJ9638062.1 hypothetical protein H2204_004373 [Knufia peltigerae]KIW43904.1 hypothetical protein PV06_04955 [Exophiala oligosperma]
MHPAKRRRLDQSATSLTKPFRSPLRNHSSNHSHKGDISSPEKRLHEATKQSSPPVTTSHDADRTSTSPVGPESTHPDRNIDPGLDHKSNQKQHIALSLQLKKLSQSLDLAQQVLHIETSQQDAQLRCLISKWKQVARNVAEQLFEEAKERINDMGGFTAWQARLQEDARLWHDVQRTSHESPRSKVDEDSSREFATTETERHTTAEYEDTHPSFFTMDKMLREMNIDLKLIGYDNESEGWID